MGDSSIEMKEGKGMPRAAMRQVNLFATMARMFRIYSWELV